MTRTATLISFVFCLTLSYGQGIKFESADWESILAKAKQENKLVFVDGMTEWCKPCKWMDANVFPLEDVGRFFNANFICVKMDMEKGEGPELRKRYSINAFPTYLFVDPDGNLVHREGGSKKAEVFIEIGKKALDPLTNLQGMHAQYKAGDRSREFLRIYIPALGKAKQKEKQNNVFDAYFRSIPPSDLINEKDYEVIMSTVVPGDEALFFILENQEAFKAIVGDRQFNSKIYGKFIFPFSLLVNGNKLDEMKSIAEKHKPYAPEIVQKAEDVAMIRWYSRQGLTKELTDACVHYVRSVTPRSPADMVTYMTMVLNAQDMDPENYAEAVQLTGEAVSAFADNYSLRDVYAGLLFKSGRIDEAVSEAEKVLATAPADKKEALRARKILEE